MFYFLKADAFKAVVNGTQKVSALNKRMRLLNQQLKDLEGHIYIYGDNYYGRLINKNVDNHVHGFLDSAPFRDCVDDKTVLAVEHLKQVVTEQVAAIILATDNHSQAMSEKVVEQNPCLAKKIICF